MAGLGLSAPPWVQPFLAALGACGNVTRAARLAGVDVTGPYNRRNRYPDFKDAWERVLGEREARAAGSSAGLGMSGEVQATGSNHALAPLACGGSRSLALAGEGRVGPAGDGVKLSRVAATRWSKGTEDRFLEELTACANVARAAAEVGFSAASAYKKRLREPRFAQG